MATVSIRPLPMGYREILPRFRPQHPPIFDGEPTAEDVALARELFEALDLESQQWYGGSEFLAKAG
jgi:hypothetical protein